MFQFVTGFLIMLSMAFTDGRKLIIHESQYTFEKTQERLLQALNNNQLRVFATIDHQQGAESVGLEMEKATIILFGNPKVGTSLMQENAAAAIDLPLKFLLYETVSGNVMLSYFDISFMETEYGINQPDKLSKIAANLEKIALASTQ